MWYNALMDKLKSIVTLLILFAIGAGVFFFLKNRKPEANFTLYKEDGSVLYKTQNGSYSTLTENQIILENHSFIKTEQGSAHVIFPDNSLMSIDENTELQINIDSSETVINQFVGNTWHRVQKLSSEKGYKVETPTTVATVRGTKFSVEVDSKNGFASNIYVTESKVEVGQISKDKETKTIKNTELVQTGQYAKVESILKRQKFDITALPKDKENTQWFRKNKKLDIEFGQKDFDALLKSAQEDADLIRSKATPTPVKKPTATKIPSTLSPTVTPTNDPDAAFKLEIEAKIKYYFEIIGDGSKTCSIFNQTTQQNILDSLTAIENKYGKDNVVASQFSSLTKTIYSFCRDGIISDPEKDQLKSMYPSN
jgi:hypothetical protein